MVAAVLARGLGPLSPRNMEEATRREQARERTGGTPTRNSYDPFTHVQRSIAANAMANLDGHAVDIDDPAVCPLCCMAAIHAEQFSEQQWLDQAVQQTAALAREFGLLTVQ
jgi:hypothetical protein